MLASIKETCLYVHDLAVCKAFYADKLGLEVISYVSDRHVFFRVGPDVLLCFNAEATAKEKTLPPHYANGRQHMAFQVPKEEYVEEKSRILAMGIAITHQQKWEGGYESFYFDDPDGHVLEVVPEGMWD